jgi:hypothetical protein
MGTSVGSQAAKLAVILPVPTVDGVTTTGTVTVCCETPAPVASSVIG